RPPGDARHEGAPVALPEGELAVALDQRRRDLALVTVAVAKRLLGDRPGIELRHQPRDARDPGQAEDERRPIDPVPGRIEEHERPDLRRVRNGIAPGDLPAERIAGERETVQPELAAEGVDERDVGVDPVVVVPVGPREPEPGQVHADDAEMAAERLGPRIPGVERRARPGQWNEGWTVALVAVVARDAAAVGEPRRAGWVALVPLVQPDVAGM